MADSHEPSVGERRARLMALADAQRLQLHADLAQMKQAAVTRVEDPIKKLKVPAALALGAALLSIAVRKRKPTPPTRRFSDFFSGLTKRRDTPEKAAAKGTALGTAVGLLPIALMWIQRARSVAQAYSTFRHLMPGARAASAQPGGPGPAIGSMGTIGRRLP